MTNPRIGIIISSTRQGRFGDQVAKWVLEIARQRTDLDFELVDLRDYPLPLFDQPMSPRFKTIEAPEVKRWAATIAGLDGYIFVTAEYNHAITAVLKNALDHLYHEPAKKPAAFIGYGEVGGARAVEQLRMMAIELNLVALKSATHIGLEPFLGIRREGKSFDAYPYLAPYVTAMLEELAWYATALKAARATGAAEASIAA